MHAQLSSACYYTEDILHYPQFSYGIKVHLYKFFYAIISIVNSDICAIKILIFFHNRLTKLHEKFHAWKNRGLEMTCMKMKFRCMKMKFPCIKRKTLSQNDHGWKFPANSLKLCTTLLSIKISRAKKSSKGQNCSCMKMSFSCMNIHAMILSCMPLFVRESHKVFSES